MASVTISRSLEYVAAGADPAHWLLTASVTDTTNAPKKVFVLEIQRLRDTSSGNPQGWKWVTGSFLRVASPAEMTTILTSDYAALDPATADPATGVAGVYKNGFHLYRANSATAKYDTYGAGKAAYDSITAKIRALVYPDDAVNDGALRLSVVGPTPKKDPNVSFSVYPGDTITFTGVEGAGDYTYAITDLDGTDSSVVTSTGVFTAGNIGADAYKEVAVQVTDTVGDTSLLPSHTGTSGNLITALTIVSPTALSVVGEVISSG